MINSIDIIIGAILPVLLEYLFKLIKSNSKIKFAVSLIIPLFVGGLLNYEQLDAANVSSVLASGTLIFTAAQSVYKIYFKDSGLRERITK